MPIKMITHDELKNAVEYKESTGEFIVKDSFHKSRIGKIIVETITSNGYKKFMIRGVVKYSHQWVWFYKTGKFPEFQIDHIDGNRLNNSISNLRNGSGFINNQNIKCARSFSTTGVLGVRRSKNGKFDAVIFVEGRNKYLGRFENKESAGAAYLSAKRLLHKGCTI